MSSALIFHFVFNKYLWPPKSIPWPYGLLKEFPILSSCLYSWPMLQFILNMTARGMLNHESDCTIHLPVDFNQVKTQTLYNPNRDPRHLSPPIPHVWLYLLALFFPYPTSTTWCLLRTHQTSASGSLYLQILRECFSPDMNMVHSFTSLLKYPQLVCSDTQCKNETSPMLPVSLACLVSTNESPSYIPFVSYLSFPTTLSPFIPLPMHSKCLNSARHVPAFNK